MIDRFPQDSQGFSPDFEPSDEMPIELMLKIAPVEILSDLVGQAEGKIKDLCVSIGKIVAHGGISVYRAGAGKLEEGNGAFIAHAVLALDITNLESNGSSMEEVNALVSGKLSEIREGLNQILGIAEDA
jgi:hypothetical protein